MGREAGEVGGDWLLGLVGEEFECLTVTNEVDEALKCTILVTG